MKTLSILMFVAILGIAPTIFAESTLLSSPTASVSPAPQKYTCPMHPEVVQDKPGKCPKCGMKLEPKKEDDKKK